LSRTERPPSAGFLVLARPTPALTARTGAPPRAGNAPRWTQSVARPSNGGCGSPARTSTSVVGGTTGATCGARQTF
jgi:hypothetical protein